MTILAAHRHVFTALAPLFVLACSGSRAGVGDPEAATTEAPLASSSQCTFVSFSPQASAFPAQTDPHATYAVVSLALDPSKPVRFEIRGEYAKANYSRFTVYDGAAMQFDARADEQLVPDEGSVNPYQEGNRVLATARNVSAVLAPPGDSLDAKNRLALPSGKSAFLVLRIYSPIRESAPIKLPTMRAIDVATGTETRCATLAVPDLSGVTLSFPAVDPTGNVGFHRIPSTPFGNGQTGYLMASLDASKVAVIHVPRLPSFFDETSVKLTSRFSSPDVRYLSLGSYGESQNTNHVVSGSEAKTDGMGAYFVVGTEELRARVEAAGLNFLPISLPKKLGIAPYIIYRNSVTRSGFPGAFVHVPLYEGPVSESPAAFEAQNYIGDYAPRGKQCTQDELFSTGCGYDAVAAKLVGR